MNDQIHIKGLKVSTTIGVPEEERECPQCVSINVSLTLLNSTSGIADDLSRTVDYYEVTEEIRKVACQKPRKLIETLAEDLAEAVLGFEGVKAVNLEVEKYIIPNCDAISVAIARGEC